MTVPLEPLHHPDDETIAAFVDGMLPNTERHDFLEHLAKCEGCYALWDGVEETRALSAAQTGGGKVVRGRFGKGRLVLTAAALAAAASVVAYVYVPQVLLEREKTALAEAAATLRYRTTEARISFDLPYREEQPVPRSAAMGKSKLDPDLAPILEPAADILARAEKRQNAATLHAEGVALLLLKQPQEALEQLQTAEKDAGGDLRLLIDLTAAALQVSEAAAHDGDATHARLAMQYAEKAWRKARTATTAWNRALALERAGETDLAIRAWEEYKHLDPQSQWTVEADARRSRLSQSRHGRLP